MSNFVIQLPMGGFHGGEYGLRGKYEIVSLDDAIKFDNVESAEARRIISIKTDIVAVL